MRPWMNHQPISLLCDRSVTILYTSVGGVAGYCGHADEVDPRPPGVEARRGVFFLRTVDRSLPSQALQESLAGSPLELKPQQLAAPLQELEQGPPQAAGPRLRSSPLAIHP